MSNQNEKYVITQTFELEDIARVASNSCRDDLQDDKKLLIKVFNEIKYHWENNFITDLNDDTIYDIINDMDGGGDLEPKQQKD